jgi:hypothetical protein
LYNNGESNVNYSIPHVTSMDVLNSIVSMGRSGSVDSLPGIGLPLQPLSSSSQSANDSKQPQQPHQASVKVEGESSHSASLPGISSSGSTLSIPSLALNASDYWPSSLNIAGMGEGSVTSASMDDIAAALYSSTASLQQLGSNNKGKQSSVIEYDTGAGTPGGPHAQQHGQNSGRQANQRRRRSSSLDETGSVVGYPLDEKESPEAKNPSESKANIGEAGSSSNAAAGAAGIPAGFSIPSQQNQQQQQQIRVKAPIMDLAGLQASSSGSNSGSGGVGGVPPGASLVNGGGNGLGPGSNNPVAESNSTTNVLKVQCLYDYLIITLFEKYCCNIPVGFIGWVRKRGGSCIGSCDCQYSKKRISRRFLVSNSLTSTSLNRVLHHFNIKI